MANWVECTSPEGTKIWVNFDNATALLSYGAKGETLISFEKGNTIHIKEKVAATCRARPKDFLAGC